MKLNSGSWKCIKDRNVINVTRLYQRDLILLLFLPFFVFLFPKIQFDEQIKWVHVNLTSDFTELKLETERETRSGIRKMSTDYDSDVPNARQMTVKTGIATIAKLNRCAADWFRIVIF